MKYLTIFSILVGVTILGCHKNDPPCPDEDTNCNDTDIIVVDTFCRFQGIILDTIKFNSVSEEELWGEWELFAYADLSECSFTTKPADIDRNVLVHFTDTGYVDGKTPGNTFWGNFLLTNDGVQFIDVRRTLVGEPDWGSDFLDAIYQTDLASIKRDTLVIYYKQSSEAMLFSKYVK